MIGYNIILLKSCDEGLIWQFVERSKYSRNVNTDLHPKGLIYRRKVLDIGF